MLRPSWGAIVPLVDVDVVLNCIGDGGAVKALIVHGECEVFRLERRHFRLHQVDLQRDSQGLAVVARAVGDCRVGGFDHRAVDGVELHLAPNHQVAVRRVDDLDYVLRRSIVIVRIGHDAWSWTGSDHGADGDGQDSKPHDRAIETTHTFATRRDGSMTQLRAFTSIDTWMSSHQLTHEGHLRGAIRVRKINAPRAAGGLRKLRV